MKILNKILAGLSAIGAVLSAVFFYLFKQEKGKTEEAKKETAQEKERADQNAVMAEAEHTAMEKLNETKVKNEDIKQTANSGNNLANFNAGLELLRK